MKAGARNAGGGAAIGALVAATIAWLGAGCSGRTVISIDPTQRFQQISGWEVTASPPDPSLASSAPNLREAVYDKAVREVGINRVRLQAPSGMESTAHLWSYPPGRLSERQWRSMHYATVNDNDDPNVINPAGFDFTELDASIDTAVLPLKRRLEARGERLIVNGCYVAFTGQISSGGYIHDDPEEYAEFVLAVYLHMRQKYGFVPDTWEVILEPDLVAQWRDGRVLGRAMAATARRLKAHGFTPRFVAPSVTDMANTVRYLDGIAAVPGALENLSEVSYHRYRRAGPVAAREIAGRARALGLRTSMLELWFGRANAAVLFEDLTQAQVSAWQGRTLWGLFDPSAKSPDGLVMRPDVRDASQVFRYVREGATRIGAHSSRSDVTPVAFLNADGREVLVIRASAAGELEIDNLKPGRFDLSYDVTGRPGLGDVAAQVQAGRPLRVAMPGAGLLTVYEAR
jgi:hypothetical protein